MAVKDPLQQTILKSALRLVNKYGYGCLSLSELAREARITKQRLYYHFPTPEDVIIVLAEEWSATGQQETLKALAESHEVGAKKILAISRGMFQWMRLYPDLSRLGLVLYQSGPHIKKLNSFMTDARNAGRERIHGLLAQDPRFKKFNSSQLDSMTTMIHSTMYGFFFYAVAMNAFENLDQQEKACEESLLQILSSGSK